MPQDGNRREPYSMPQIAPLFTPGPYVYPEVRALLTVYELDSTVSEAVVPDPLETDAKPTCLAAFYQYSHVSGLGSYNEFMIGIAASYDGTPVTYSVYYVLDSDSPLAAGREVWGLPKKFGEVYLDFGGATNTATVSRNGVELANGTVTSTEEAASHPLDTEKIWNVHWKCIPSASRDSAPVVNRLVSSQITDIDVTWAQYGPASLELSDSASDPLARLEPVGDIEGYIVKCSWKLERTADGVIHRFEEAA